MAAPGLAIRALKKRTLHSIVWNTVMVRDAEVKMLRETIDKMRGRERLVLDKVKKLDQGLGSFIDNLPSAEYLAYLGRCVDNECSRAVKKVPDMHPHEYLDGRICSHTEVLAFFVPNSFYRLVFDSRYAPILIPVSGGGKSTPQFGGIPLLVSDHVPEGHIEYFYRDN